MKSQSYFRYFPRNLEISPWFVFIGTLLWSLPQAYVGAYSSIVAAKIYFLCAIIIGLGSIIQLFRLLVKKRSLLWYICCFSASGMIMLFCIFLWKQIYSAPNQIYKLIWLVLGYSTPLWSIVCLFEITKIRGYIAGELRN